MKLSAKIASCFMVLIFLLYTVPALGSNQPVNVTFVIGTTLKTVQFEQDSFIGAYSLSANDYPAGAVSFRGWYVSEHPRPDEQPVDLTVTKVTDGTQVFYAKFSSEYLVKFLDGDLQTVLYSKEITPNSAIPAYGGTVQPYAGAGYTFTHWYITDNIIGDVPVTPGETLVTEDLIIKPAFTNQQHYVYFVSLGTQVSPGLVNHGQAIAPPNNPTRDGYRFNGWSISADGTDTYDFNDPVNGDLVLYAQWISDSDIPYTIALWMEKPNLSSALKKDDIDISLFDYVDSVEGFGKAGETISFNESNLTSEVQEMLKGKSSPLSVLRYAKFFAADSKSIAGNGSTVINLYFERKIYSWEFIITKPDYTMSVASSVYKKTEYTMEAKYEEDISNKYPVDPVALFYKNGEDANDFRCWILTDSYLKPVPNDTFSWIGKRIYVGEDMIAKDGQQLTYQAATAYFDADYVINKYRYFAQILPGETADITRTFNGRSMDFKLMPEYSQEVVEISILKTIPGFAGLNNGYIIYQENGGSYIEGDGDNSVRCFFYERNIYKLTFHDNKPSNTQGNVTGMPASPSVNKMYGEDIGSAPADPKLDGYEFVGWYKDTGGIAVQDFNTPMPNSNLAVYAKWHKNDHKLVFMDEYPGSLPALLSTTIGENECVSYSRYASPPDNLPQIGKVHQEKQLAGWMWEIPGTNFLTEFSETIPVHDDTTLYARWKTSGYKVTYSTGSGSGIPPEDPLDYNRDAQTRLLASTGIIPPNGQVFIGWTIANSLYHEGNIITITGNIEAVATFGSPQQLVTVTYHKNLDGATEIKTHYAQRNSDINLSGNETFTDSAKQLVGWQDAAGNAHALGASYHVSDANVDLYGLWENKTFAIIYYQNQDSNDLTSFEQQGQTTGQLYSILAFDAITPAFVAPAGYLFSSWNTAPDGTGTNYAVGANVSISEAGLRLYAQYAINTPDPIDGLTITGNDFTIYNTQVPESAIDPQYITWAKAVALFNQVAIPDQNTYITIDASKVQTASGIYPVSFTVNYQDQSATVTVNCTVTRSNGGSSGGSSSTSSEKDNSIDIGDTPTPLAFISDHIQYLYGYPGSNVRPDSSITRAEAAAIFHRLLANTDKNNSVTSSLNDVNSSNWFYQAVAYLNKYGIITGYPDGSFRPNQGITRAEFAAIAARFDELAPSGNNFSDVSSSYWAADYIGSAVTKGWIGGFPDGTFGPTQQITRAQVVSIVNRMLDRRILAADVPNEAPKYNDLASSHWAYADISEASCSHTYQIKSDGSTEMWDSISEISIANANSIAAADYVYGETNQSVEEVEQESTEPAEESAQEVEETTETTEE